MKTDMTAHFEDAEPDNCKHFGDFGLGDVLYVLDEGSKAIGIKVGLSNIRFITLSDGKPPSTDSLATAVPQSEMYGVPSAVDIRITR